MRFAIEYNPEFYTDLSKATDWYNQQQTGLGTRFFNAVKTQTGHLSENALHYAIRYDDIRCMKLKKFPYMVHYRIDESVSLVRVEALFHTSRNPEIWKED